MASQGDISSNSQEKKSTKAWVANPANKSIIDLFNQSQHGKDVLNSFISSGNTGGLSEIASKAGGNISNLDQALIAYNAAHPKQGWGGMLSDTIGAFGPFIKAAGVIGGIAGGANLLNTDNIFGTGGSTLADAATSGNALTDAAGAGSSGAVNAATQQAIGSGAAAADTAAGTMGGATSTMSVGNAAELSGMSVPDYLSSVGLPPTTPLETMIPVGGAAGTAAGAGGASGGIGNFITSLPGGSTGNILSLLGQGAASLYGANLGANAASDATAETKRQFDIAQQNQAPLLAAGKRALTEQQKLMFGTPQDIQTSLQATPGYQWRKQQGQQGLDAGLAARGGMGSGKSAVAASEYNQNFATNEYQNALNRLAGLSGTGQTTAGNLAQLGAGYSQAMGKSGLEAATARQSGLQGAANAFSSYLNPIKQITGYNPQTGAPIYAP